MQTLFLCTLQGTSHTMNNIQGICLPLDHIPDQYFSSYISLLHEVCDEQHNHTHQLGDIFCFLTEEYEMYYMIYRKCLGQT